VVLAVVELVVDGDTDDEDDAVVDGDTLGENEGVGDVLGRVSTGISIVFDELRHKLPRASVHVTGLIDTTRFSVLSERALTCKISAVSLWGNSVVGSRVPPLMNMSSSESPKAVSSKVAWMNACWLSKVNSDWKERRFACGPKESARSSVSANKTKGQPTSGDCD
jgi:hypothetical protein